VESRGRTLPFEPSAIAAHTVRRHSAQCGRIWFRQQPRSLLLASGLIYNVQGKGSYVTPPEDQPS
jgi:hypothetical protein